MPTPKDRKELRAMVRGFNGRFESRPEDEHCTECPYRLVFVSAHPDYVGDETVISDCIEQHIAEPLSYMLNSVGPLLDHLEEVTRANDTLAEIAEAATFVIDNGLCGGCRSQIDNIDVERIDELRKAGT